MNFKILRFLILCFLFTVMGCQKKISDEERSYSNIKVIARCIQESNQKYDNLYDYYKNDDLGSIRVVVSPFAPPDTWECTGTVSKKEASESNYYRCYITSPENFAIICGYEYFWDKNKNEIVINDKFKKDIKMTIKL